MRRALSAASVALALLGAVVLVAVAALTVASIAGRWLADAPIAGDVELVQLGTAAAIALFLPYCQLHGSHLVVDLFTARADACFNRRLDRMANVASAVVLALLAARAATGVADLSRAHETSMVLGIPLWLPYATMAPSLALAAAVALLGPGARSAVGAGAAPTSSHAQSR